MSTKQNKLSFWVVVIYVLIWNNFSAFQLSSLYNKNKIIFFSSSAALLVLTKRDKTGAFMYIPVLACYNIFLQPLKN